MKDVLDATQAYGPPVLGTAACLYVGYRVVRIYQRKRAIAARGAEAAAARQLASERLASASPDTLLTQDGRDITTLSLDDLREEIRSGRLPAVQVLRSYTRKALDVSTSLNCVTEPLSLDGCEAMADQLDARLADENDSSELGLLHGLPVSIKENLDVAGMHSTLGLRSRLHLQATRDALIVRVLRAHGAIPFVKTNVPQTLLSFDCSNPIYGTTRNPHNLARTPGGSSGGEGALIAGGGSILGIGTDIGGSVRIPAAFCGVCGLKPTGNRISGVGVSGLFKGQTGVAYSPGVLARDVSGCELLMKALCSQQMFDVDAGVIPITWRDEASSSKRKLRIGYFQTVDFFHATPAVQRSVQEARDALRRAGHEVVEFAPPDFQEIMSLYYKLIVADGLDTVVSAMPNDDLDTSVRYGFFLLSIPKFIRRLTSFIFQHTWTRMAALLGNMERKSVQTLWELQAEAGSVRQQFYNSIRAANLDGLICPAHPIGPLPLGKCASLTASASYTAVFNLYNVPAGVVPVTKATKEDEADLASYPHRDLWGYHSRMYAQGMEGLPLSVQCVTLPWQEEECVYLMKELEASLRA